MFTTERGKQETSDPTKKIQGKAELHPAKQVVVDCMRRDELETSASTRGVAMITEKCNCREIFSTQSPVFLKGIVKTKVHLVAGGSLYFLAYP